MITRDQAIALRDLLREQGRPWAPVNGDRFMVADAIDLDDVFVVADMTIEVHNLPTGSLIRFNGTTEWALDSIGLERAVWLPWEHQLRDLLGERFVSLERLPGDPVGWAVMLDDGSRHVDIDAELALLRALGITVAE
ncbi:pilus assembly protein CpaE [Aestuariimicrobium ganziense]|uniref:pilus assembly protein CpaE n=1 Tax=Aestuariimicrobium ganziense TaxID=2773677 RepID=UPI0019457570|nr:pilus assembly protein CpaE [Aestuariimicrobium ganziense]